MLRNLAKICRASSLQNGMTARFMSTASKRRTVTLVRGEGIGPECTNAVVHTLAAMNAPIDWECFELTDPKKNPEIVDRFTPELRESFARNKFVLKGPHGTPPAANFLSPDVQMAKDFGIYAHVVPVKNVPGIKTRHDNVDMVIIRENTEGEYSGLEHEVNPGIVQSLKVITRKASRRVAEYAFKYAVANGRKKVTAVHKANIMKRADGLFLQTCREVAGLYQGVVEFDEIIIDNCCMQLVSNPEQFDVLVTPNLYGNIVSEAAAGLVGGVGIVPGFNVSDDIRVYEQGPRHLGLDIAGKNLSNPTSYLLASCLMLRDMGLGEYADSLETAVKKTILEGDTKVLTRDVCKGKGTTASFTDAVIKNIIPPEPVL